jgi:hypothetical protein
LGRLRHGRDHAPERQLEAARLALAGVAHEGYGTRGSARQDSVAAYSTLAADQLLSGVSIASDAITTRIKWRTIYFGSMRILKVLLKQIVSDVATEKRGPPKKCRMGDGMKSSHVLRDYVL